MYVCICNGYRESDLLKIAKKGVQCAKQAYRELGAGPRCGKCLSFAQATINAAHAGDFESAAKLTTTPNSKRR